MDHKQLFTGQDPDRWNEWRRDESEKHMAEPWADPLTDPIVVKAINETIAELAARQSAVGEPIAMPLSGLVEPPKLQ